MQAIDLEKRNQFSRLHSMGHLISAIVAEKYPDLHASKGNHFPGGQSYVLFQGSPIPDKEELKSYLLDKVAQILDADVKVRSLSSLVLSAQPDPLLAPVQVSLKRHNALFIESVAMEISCTS